MTFSGVLLNLSVLYTLLYTLVQFPPTTQMRQTAMHTVTATIHVEKPDFQTQQRGYDDAEYQIYLACADNGKGIDITTGEPLKTYDEWLNS